MMHLDPLLEATYTHVLYLTHDAVDVAGIPLTPDSSELAIIRDLVDIVAAWTPDDEPGIALVEWADVDERERERLSAQVADHEHDALTMSTLLSDDAQA